MSDLFITLWLQSKLLHYFIKEICLTFMHKNWKEMPQKKKDLGIFVSKTWGLTLVLFANDC